MTQGRRPSPWWIVAALAAVPFWTLGTLAAQERRPAPTARAQPEVAPRSAPGAAQKVAPNPAPAPSVASLDGRVAALERQVEELRRELAEARAAVSVAGGNVTVRATGTLDLRGAVIRLNGGSKPIVGGPLVLAPGQPLCVAATAQGSFPCTGQGLALATGSPTVFVP